MPIPISPGSTSFTSLPVDNSEPSLLDLEALVASTIKAKDDFTQSRLPSSPSHYGYWLLAGASGTGSALLAGGSAALGVNLAEEIHESNHSWAYTKLESIAALGVVAVPLFPALVLAKLCNEAVSKINHDNKLIENDLQRDIDEACQCLADAARELPQVEFEELLKRSVAPLPSLIEACNQDPDKASALAEYLLKAQQLAPLGRLADLGWHQCLAVGDALLKALKAPEDFIGMLEKHPAAAADVLAVLCMEASAMIEDAPPKLDAYLQDHPEVARQALLDLKARAQKFDLYDLPYQIEQGRLGGIAMAIVRHAQSLEAQPEPD